MKEINNCVEINGRSYKIKNTLRSIFIFERITEKPFKTETMLDNYIYLYSVILACNPDDPLSWDEFINAVDENPSIGEHINRIMAEALNLEKALEEKAKEGDEESKKKLA